MLTDLWQALTHPENARGHPILTAMLYAFCPAAARWWLAGVEPKAPFDPLWQALADLTGKETLRDALIRHGFEGLVEEARTYVEEVRTFRRANPAVRAAELLPTFSGGRLDLSSRFNHNAAIQQFGKKWDHFFIYVRTWAYLASDWESSLNISTQPEFTQVHVVLRVQESKRPVYYPAWQWLEVIGKGRRVMLGLPCGERNDELRFALLSRSAPQGEKPWPSPPEIWKLESITASAVAFEPVLPDEAYIPMVRQLNQAARAGTCPPIHAFKNSAKCRSICAFSEQCFPERSRLLSTESLMPPSENQT